MRAIYLFVTLIFFNISLEAQDSVKEQLIFYGDVMVNAQEVTTRSLAHQKFENILEAYLDSTDLTSIDLGFLKWASVLQPDDKSFTLISWQAELKDYNYAYGAYVIVGDSIVKFNQTDLPMNQIDAMMIEPSDWYGALYYNLLPLSEGRYTIFGFNGSGKWMNTKIADVLTINDDGSIKLGAAIYEDKGSPGTFQERLVFQYSSDASFNLNYNPGLKLIVNDHLIQRIGRLEGQGPVNLPDGSYEGYEMKEGKWYYVEKIYEHKYDEAPRPKPVLNNSDKSIFGKN
ncbi:MAG: hypothetical protein HKN09_09595 [Saprospiraceae bacterium]|nr:hypothetical protein [Saprospiraceae bacterium]